MKTPSDDASSLHRTVFYMILKPDFIFIRILSGHTADIIAGSLSPITKLYAFFVNADGFRVVSGDI